MGQHVPFLLTSLGVAFPVLATLGSHLTQGWGGRTAQGNPRHWMRTAFEDHSVIFKYFMLEVMATLTSSPAVCPRLLPGAQTPAQAASAPQGVSALTAPLSQPNDFLLSHFSC